MRITTVLARILALKQTRIRGVQQEPEGLVLDVTPSTRVPILGRHPKPAKHDHLKTGQRS